MIIQEEESDKLSLRHKDNYTIFTEKWPTLEHFIYGGLITNILEKEILKNTLSSQVKRVAFDFFNKKIKEETEISIHKALNLALEQHENFRNALIFTIGETRILTISTDSMFRKLFVQELNKVKHQAIYNFRVQDFNNQKQSVIQELTLIYNTFLGLKRLDNIEMYRGENYDTILRMAFPKVDMHGNIIDEVDTSLLISDVTTLFDLDKLDNIVYEEYFNPGTLVDNMIYREIFKDSQGDIMLKEFIRETIQKKYSNLTEQEQEIAIFQFYSNSKPEELNALRKALKSKGYEKKEESVRFVHNRNAVLDKLNTPSIQIGQLNNSSIVVFRIRETKLITQTKRGNGPEGELEIIQKKEATTIYDQTTDEIKESFIISYNERILEGYEPSNVIFTIQDSKEEILERTVIDSFPAIYLTDLIRDFSILDPYQQLELTEGEIRPTKLKEKQYGVTNYIKLQKQYKQQLQQEEENIKRKINIVNRLQEEGKLEDEIIKPYGSVNDYIYTEKWNLRAKLDDINNLLTKEKELYRGEIKTYNSIIEYIYTRVCTLNNVECDFSEFNGLIPITFETLIQNHKSEIIKTRLNQGLKLKLREYRTEIPVGEVIQYNSQDPILAEHVGRIYMELRSKLSEQTDGLYVLGNIPWSMRRAEDIIRTISILRQYKGKVLASTVISGLYNACDIQIQRLKIEMKEVGLLLKEFGNNIKMVNDRKRISTPIIRLLKRGMKLKILSPDEEVGYLLDNIANKYDFELTRADKDVIWEHIKLLNAFIPDGFLFEKDNNEIQTENTISQNINHPIIESALQRISRFIKNNVNLYENVIRSVSIYILDNSLENLSLEFNNMETVANRSIFFAEPEINIREELKVKSYQEKFFDFFNPKKEELEQQFKDKLNLKGDNTIVNIQEVDKMLQEYKNPSKKFVDEIIEDFEEKEEED